jgi:hypothetical protein
MFGALLALCAASCASEQRRAEEQQSANMKLIVEAPREVREVILPAATGKCTFDAMKICRVYGGVGMKAESRAISIQIPPDGPTIPVQCRYQEGEVVSATPPPNLQLDGNAEAFLAAHGFCLSK